ncbi:MAG: vitamin K epoxide reductase family protein, partial [Verrucomicrobiota bacterium]|nr:vitamin K epoxide reductase family protein [Verrucomicrobiota bacterium]
MIPLWSYFLLSFLGLWLIATPLTFPASPPLFWSDLLAGLLLFSLSLAARKPQPPLKQRLFYYAFLAIALWLELAPLLFWAPSPLLYLNDTLLGVLIIAFVLLLFPLPSQLPEEEPTVPPGFSYNPSSWPQRIPIILSALLCWFYSRYLAAYQLGYIDTVWDPFFIPGAKGVLTSSVAHLFPVSDAGLGAFAYTLEFLAACLGGKARWRTAPWLTLIFAFLVIPVGLVSIILVILQPLVVGTWCTLCLLTAATMLIAVPLAMDEIVASFSYLRRTRWKTLFPGGEDPQATEDRCTPPLTDSLASIFRAGFWGLSVSWPLLFSLPLGLFLMTQPSPADP